LPRARDGLEAGLKDYRQRGTQPWEDETVSLNLHELYTGLKKEGIIFCFCGSVSQSIVEGIGETLWQRLEIEGTEMSTIGRVFPIFVEQMQNIVSHSSERITSEKTGGEEIRFGIMIVGKSSDGRFYITCGNYVDKAAAESIRQKLEGIREMDKDQLKDLYREQRKQAKSDGKSKGAGLGFIDMARRASAPLEYDIVPVNAETSFFSMTTTV
jgi:hypothetical protein